MSPRLAWFTKPSPLLRYTAAVLLAVAAQLARIPLHPPTVIPFITYIPFMTIAAWFGRLGPSMLSTALCTLECAYFAAPPIHSFAIEAPRDWVGLGALVLSGLVKSLLFDRLQRDRNKLAVAAETQQRLTGEVEAKQRVLESIIQQSPAAIALVSGADFTFTSVNPAYQALVPGESIVGRTVAEVWPNAASLVVPLLRAVRDARTVYHADGMAIPRGREPGTPDIHYYNFSYVPVKDIEPNGEVSVLVVAIDVTQLKKAEQDLRLAYSELAAIYASSPVVLMVVNENLRVEKLNDRGAWVTGREISELLGLSPGGALGCLDALANPEGCGSGPSCAQCPLRVAVLDSVRNGGRHEGLEIWVPSASGQVGPRCFLISTAPLPFNSHHNALICAQDITDLKRTERDLRETVDKLKSALTEKTVLLQEVHHRVKNNLAVISSLLNMKAEVTEGAEAKLALAESQRRVHSIALVHEHLYGSEHLDRINFAEYTQQLVQALYANFAGEPARIALRMEMDPIDLGVHTAVPAALILNELLSNAFKHGFLDGRRGEIHVTFHEPEPGHMELAVEDDGVGSVGVLEEKKSTSLGMQIVRVLATQLGGTLKQEPSSGTRIVLRFPAGAALKAGQ